MIRPQAAQALGKDDVSGMAFLLFVFSLDYFKRYKAVFLFSV